MKSNSLVFNSHIKKVPVDTSYDPTSKVVSYSQYSMYQKCPKQWELGYARNLRPRESSIHLVYGTAMHEVIQEWLTVAFTESVKASENFNFMVKFREALSNEYKKAYEVQKTHFSTPKELKEFYEDGVTTLEWLRKKRRAYFSSKGVELAGIEVPLSLVPIGERPKVKLTAFLDLVFYDKRDDTYLILDLKTSTRGWSANDKKDRVKTDQVLLYKKYFSTLYNVDQEKIKVEFLILRRKLDEDSMYPMKRVQTIVPAQKGVSINKFTKDWEKWILDCFTPEGQYILDRFYPAISGKDKSNCRFCPFSTKYDLCPISSRTPGSISK